MKDEKNKELLTRKELARQLKVAPETITRWTK